MSGGEIVSPVMRKLSTYMAQALKRKPPADVVERAKVLLVDTLAAMISGSRLLAGKRAISYVKPLGGRLEAGVAGTRIVTSVAHAAFANGICAHADETDAVHTPRGHLAACVIPAALSIAEREQASGAALLRAIVLGYDVGTRMLLALKQTKSTSVAHHPSPKAGLCGSAAASAALLKLDAKQMRYVLSYCAERAGGLLLVRRDSQHTEKAYVQGGMPAHDGVESALMVASGFTGVEDVFDGDDSFLSVFSPDADRDALNRGLGRDYQIMNGRIKYWPVGAPIQAPLHVLRDLMRQYGFKAVDVEKLHVRLPDKELKIVDNRDMPDITLQHLLAVMLLDGGLTFEMAHNYARMKDPRVLKLRRNSIEAIGDPSLTDVPLRRWRCVMDIILKDGRRLTHRTMACKGSVENPLTRSEEEEKALDLMAPVMGKKRSLALMAALFDMDKLKNARALRKLYAA